MIGTTDDRQHSPKVQAGLATEILAPQGYSFSLNALMDTNQKALSGG
jgi:hypothetical protein